MRLNVFVFCLCLSLFSFASGSSNDLEEHIENVNNAFLNYFPRDLIVHILKQLNKTDRMNVGLVNSTLRTIDTQSISFVELGGSKYILNKEDNIFSNLKNDYSHISKLHAPSAPYLTAKDLSSLQNLKNLWLGTFYPDGNTSFEFLFYLTRLSSLDLYNCSEISEQGIPYLSLQTNLTDLRLRYARFSHNLFTQLAKLDLTKLDCSGSYNLDELYHFSSLSNLDNLILSSCGFSNVSSLMALALCSQLKHLRLDGCDAVNDICLESILSSLTNLESLDLSSCYKITDHGLKSISLLTNLHHLELCCLYRISDSSMPHLSLLPLNTLQLSRCRQLKDPGLLRLSLLTNLRQLYLDECDHMTDEGFLSINRLVQLQTLTLKYNAITDKGLEALSQLTNLSFLDLAGCCAITNRGLKALSALRNLSYLDVMGCAFITETGIQYLLSLRGLDCLCR